MSHYFQIDDWFFYPHKNEVHRKQEVYKVRPKTAELFTVLLKANGEVVSKQELLDLVWNDVVAEEYVIFQSIAELRKLFGEQSIIKTHPRKGYSITASVSEITDKGSEPKTKSNIQNTSENKKTSVKLLAIVIVCLFSAALYFVSLIHTPNLGPGSVVVLPVKNHTQDNNHSWLKYGGMDLIIKRLTGHMTHSILQTEDVLDIVERAQVNLDYLDPESISRIFEVSGAEFIIEPTLSGSTRDYQLVYSFHRKGDTKRGALFSNDIESLFVDLNTRILEFADIQSNNKPNDYHNDFTNGLVAQAVDQLQNKRYCQAASMLEAVLVNEPENLTVYKLLSQAFTLAGNADRAQIISLKGINLANKHNDKHALARILFWKALSIAMQKDYERAIPALNHAKQAAADVNDMLYTANVAKVMGRVYLAQQEFELAHKEFDIALNSHEAIQCPFGRSNALIDLGELAYQQQEMATAEQYFRQASELSKQRQLTDTQVLAEQWLTIVQKNN